jgi:hypothetical protein
MIIQKTRKCEVGRAEYQRSIRSELAVSARVTDILAVGKRGRTPQWGKIGIHWSSYLLAHFSQRAGQDKSYLRNLTKKLPAPSRGPLGFRKSPTTIVENRTIWIAALHANLMISTALSSPRAVRNKRIRT